MDWETWRSRKIVFVKPHVNVRGGTDYRTKDGNVIPAEQLKHEYEKMEEKSS